MARLKKTEASKHVVVVAAPKVYVPQTPITEEGKRSFFDQAMKNWDEQAEHYGYEESKPDHVRLKIQSILGAVDLEQARLLTLKAIQATQVSILAAWASGRIEGPISIRSLEKKIRSAESLVGMLREKGLHEQALTQVDRAARLRDQLEDLRKEL